MAAGYQANLLDINLEAIHSFKLWLDDSAHNDAFFTALGMDPTDRTTLRNAFADLGGASGLWAVAHGTFAPSGASNYFANSKLLSGVTYTG